MNRIILFRYHKKPFVCRDRLRHLRNFNPGVKIYGLYGGKESEFAKYSKYLGPYLEHNFCLKGKSNYRKWKNSDLAVRLWYKQIGKKIDFDLLHIIEWDLLLFDPLDKIYKKIPANGVGLTALTAMEKIISKWHWIDVEPYKSQWERLLAYAEKRYGYNKRPYASLGPGTCLPKRFLDKLSGVFVPELSNDEVRWPLFGQIFGFKLYDTGFYAKWSDKKIEKFFNCHGDEIPWNRIKKELKRRGGRKSFHPYRKLLGNI